MDKRCTFLFKNYLINILLTDHDVTKTIKQIAMEVEKRLCYNMSSQRNSWKDVDFKSPET